MIVRMTQRMRTRFKCAPKNWLMPAVVDFKSAISVKVRHGKTQFRSVKLINGVAKPTHKPKIMKTKTTEYPFSLVLLNYGKTCCFPLLQ